MPLFPTYLFVHINRQERTRVLDSPGVLQIVGSGNEPVQVLNSEVEFLRSGFCRQRMEPYRDLVVGERVRIRSGLMQGVEGTLVRRGGGMRFVMTVQLINQNAAIQVGAEELERIVA